MIMRKDCAFQDGSYPCGYKDGGKLPDCKLCHKIRKAGYEQSVLDNDEWCRGRYEKGRFEERTKIANRLVALIHNTHKSHDDLFMTLPKFIEALKERGL